MVAHCPFHRIVGYQKSDGYCWPKSENQIFGTAPQNKEDKESKRQACQDKRAGE